MSRNTTNLKAFLVAIATVIFVACAVNPAVAAEKEKADQTQFIRGAKAWTDQCERCHNLRDPKEFTDGIWDVSVNHMRIRANIPARVARDIKAFLKASN